MYLHELIKIVYDKHRGLPVRLSERNGVSPEWYRSWSYPLPTLDANGNGRKCSELEAYFELVEKFESGSKGAGLDLSHLVFAEINNRLRQADPARTLREIRRLILKESCEALQALDEKELGDCSTEDIKRMVSEINDIVRAANEGLDTLHRVLDERS